MNDLRFALRSLHKRPRHTALVAATLALGIAATVAVHTVVRDVLLQEAPYPDSERLVLIWRGTTESPDQRGALSPPDVIDIREGATSFSDVAAVNSFSTNFVGDDGEPEQIQLGVVTGNFFSMLGVRPALGRGIETEDDRPLNTRDPSSVGVLVLDHDFWLRRFGADSGIVGRTVRIGGSRMLVLGVLPADFRLHMPAGSGMSTALAGWTPLGIDFASAPRDGAYLKVVARLSRGAAIGSAQAEVEGIAMRIRDAFPAHADAGFQLRVVPLQRDIVAHVRPVLLLLGATGVVVLLVAWANSAVLVLVRTLERREEFAVRAALGADRRHILRQLLLESLVIAFAGTALGVALAVPAVTMLLALEPGMVPRMTEIGVDRSVWLPALILALGATIACGAVPALLATRGAGGMLRTRDAVTPGASALRRMLVAGQVGAAFVLLFGAGSLLGTIAQLRQVDLGFEPAGAHTFRVTLPFAQYQNPDAWVGFFDELTERLRARPEIAAAAFTSELPMTASAVADPYVPTERGSDVAWGSRTAMHTIVSPGYFAAAGIALLQGRDFGPGDRDGGAAVAIVDQALARQLERERPGPVAGRQLDVTVHEFQSGYNVARRTVQIIGVASVVPHDHPAAEAPGTIYLPHAQHPLWSMSLLVRGGQGDAMLSAARGALGEMNPDLPMIAPQPVEELVSAVLAPTHFLLALTGFFGVVGIALTGVALYGVVADSVRQRRRELGIRMAIGASPSRLARRVLGEGLLLAGAGALPALLLVPLVSHTLERAVVVPEGVRAPALGVALTVLIIVAWAAAYGPARRAARVDPMEALRSE